MIASTQILNYKLMLPYTYAKLALSCVVCSTYQKKIADKFSLFFKFEDGNQ